MNIKTICIAMTCKKEMEAEIGENSVTYRFNVTTQPRFSDFRATNLLL